MKYKFITYPRGSGKSYMDAKINWIKKYGILNMWRDYCMSNGLAYKIRYL